MATKRRIFIQSLALVTILFTANSLPAVAQPSVNNQELALIKRENLTSNSEHKHAVASFRLPVSNLQLSTFNVQPKYEFRAAWIATVVNIDWPSKKGLPVDEQKEEYITMLDSLQHLGMNAVIVQIRPAADAFYPSPYEPWSEWLTGTQGIAPEPYYDPLKFMIDEAHKRGMEFHAWLNPYRAVFDMRNSSVASTHITRVHKDWFLTYGGKKYFNPGLPQVMQYVTNVMKDVAKRYDVDAIHMD